MIVDCDFLDHWKTRLAVDLLGGDEMAPLYILRLWAHCQARKKADAFAISAAGLRALCRCTSASGEALEAALIEAGFIEREGESIRVIDWAKRNAQLISAWTNGRKGGEANKARRGSDPTEPVPNGDRNATETGPGGDRIGTDGEAIRSRKEVDKEKSKTKAARTAPAMEILTAAGVPEQIAADWIAHRNAKRATASATVIEDRKRVCAEAGVSLADGLALEISRGWQGLKADWIANAMTASRAHPAISFQLPQDRAREWADVATGANSDERRIIDITPTTAARLD
ncbi:MAG: hypothetical protein ACJ72N_07555 [Labedaea sp.]|jgi:hypothetical protein